MPRWQSLCKSKRNKMRLQGPSQLRLLLLLCLWLTLSALIDTSMLKRRRSLLSHAASVLHVELNTKSVTHASKDLPSLRGSQCLTHQSKIERTPPISDSTTRSNLRRVLRAEWLESPPPRRISTRTLPVPTSVAGDYRQTSELAEKNMDVK